MADLSVGDRPAPAPAPSPPGATPAWALAAFLLGGLVLLAIALGAWMVSSGNDQEAAVGQWKGTELPNAPARPDAVLVDTSGQPYDLRSETAGELTVLFFGYTNCPDACPIQMATLSQALPRTDVPVKVLFVTTDPERDTPEVLRRWLDNYSSDFVGLTGTSEQLSALQSDMQVSTALRADAEADGGYLVGHYTGAFLITPDDRAHLVYGFGTRQQDWLDDLPKVAEHEEWSAAVPGRASEPPS